MNQPPRYVGLPNIWAGMSPGMVRRMLPQYGNMNHGATPAAHGSGYPPPQPTGFQGTSSQANMPPFEMRQAPATQLTAPAQLQLAQPSYNPAPSPYGLAAMPPQALVYRQSRTPESRTPTTRKRTRGQLEEEPDEDEAAKRPKTAGSGSHTNQGYASAASDQNQNQNQNQESLFAPPTAAATAVGANPSAAIPGPATGLANPSTTTTSHHTTMVNPSPAIPGLSTATTVPTVPTATAEASGSVPAPVGFSDTWDIDFTDIPDFMGPFDFSVYPELPDDQNANNNNGA
ncbi:hypothetical protein F5Y04DRAFT_250430 [Hypomontagnella monticulosa]|nr:hypothetical protein F5Y04DRAFT_250430 [Hypomontagnella monticulosa]